MRFLLRLLINAAALWVATRLVPGISATGTPGTFLAVALVFGLPIEARPQDIPTSLEMDVSALDIGDQVRLTDLALPAGVTATIEADALIAQVVAPRVVTEEEEEGEPVEGEGVEGEAAEGEAAESTSGDEGGGE